MSCCRWRMRSARWRRKPEEHASDRRTKCARDANSDGCRQELMPERPVRRPLSVRQALSDAPSDVHERSFLAEAEARAQHADHAEALADVGPEAEHVWQVYSGHDGSQLWNTTTGGLRANVLYTCDCHSSE